MNDTSQLDIVAMSADLVAAFVSNNSVSAHDLPVLITQVHSAFASLTSGAVPAADVTPVAKLTSGQIRKSITPDALISFIDGRPYKSLKRHLTAHGLDFGAYRERYGLPSDYPTVSANYSAARSALAKSFGLGQPRQTMKPEPAPALKTAKPKRAARSRKPSAEPA